MKKLVILGVTFLFASSLFSATIRVPADQPTIQAGIDASVNGDTVLVADGTYTGVGNRGIRYNGRTIVVKSENGPDSCIIDCQGGAGGFIFRSGEPPAAILDGLTIINGNAQHGGAIQSNLGASPTIVNCVMRLNIGDFGGAIFTDNGSSNNIIDCKFFDNSARLGGAINFYSSGASLTGCLFVNNTASKGGGLYLNNGVSTLTNCSFVSNSGTSAGGGIWGANANTVIENCIIAYSKQGEAILCSSVPVISCSNLFLNSGGDWIGCITGQDTMNENFSRNPQFCDTASQNFSISDCSPCAPQNNSCSTLIGALPVLCFTEFADTDSDGLRDCEDNCPTVFNPGQENFDSDFVGDSCDNCPNTNNPLQEDSDNDGFGNACDNCSFDSNIGQDDADNDGIGDVCDFCPFDPLNDLDSDSICASIDNCPDSYNPNQTDTDSDGIGDSCDICPGFDDTVDNDGDGVPDGCDICPFDSLGDLDADSICASIDNCPNSYNPNQTDTDSDGIGDSCDICPGFDDTADNDGDGVPDGCDICSFDPYNDIDADGICGDLDNCPYSYNPNQTDTDGDGTGDVCDICEVFDDNSPSIYICTGEAESDGLGLSVESAGDVNNDGFDDLIVGTRSNRRAYVFSGQTGNPLYVFADAGASVASAGDVDNDGFDDLIVVAPGRTIIFSGQTGDTIYFFSGGNSVASAGDVDNDGFGDVIIGHRGVANVSPGRVIVFSGQTGDTIHVVTGDAEWTSFGRSLASAGDVDNDGFDDFIVSEIMLNAVRDIVAWRMYVFSGQSGDMIYVFSGPSSATDLPGSCHNISVASAGDVNNDGFDDLIVGVPCSNAGGTKAGQAIVFSGQTGDTLYDFTGISVGDRLGISVASAGDLDSDGYDDLIVGAYLRDDGGLNVGQAYVFSGRTGDTISVLTGLVARDWFGWSVASAGDVNGDGINDLIVGAYRNDAGGTDAGQIYVYSGYDLTCCTGIRGDVNGDGPDANILDLTHLVDYIFRGSGDAGPCPNESDVNGDGGVANILDLTYLVDVIFRGGPIPPGC